jgi:hypothetical protein
MCLGRVVAYRDTPRSHSIHCSYTASHPLEDDPHTMWLMISCVATKAYTMPKLVLVSLQCSEGDQED